MANLNFTIPRWSGPLVGMILGLLIGLQGTQQTELPLWLMLASGMAIGGFAGCFILLLEPSSTPRKWGGKSNVAADNTSTATGKALALIGALFCVIPVLGLLINTVGVWYNWTVTDWARLTSVIAFGLSSIVMIPVVIIVLGAFID